MQLRFAVCMGLALSCRTVSDERVNAPALAAEAQDASRDADANDAGSTLLPAPGDAAMAPFTLHHVILTGQSLALGAEGYPPLSTEQPFHNVMFASASGGVLAGSGELAQKRGVFLPLVEHPFETPASGLANQVAAWTNDTHPMLMSAHGVGSHTYAALKRGTAIYTFAMAHVDLAQRMARENGWNCSVSAVALIHGESDHVEKNPRYKRDLLEWQADYERDVRARTGQTHPVPMLESQMSSFTRYGQSTSAIPLAQLSAAEESLGKIVLVGAKYHLPYADGIHLTARGYRQLGEEFAKVYRRVVIEGGSWEPLHPIGATAKGSEVRVRFHVPAPPIVFDTEAISDPGHFGFEVIDASRSPPHIERVQAEGDDTVILTLSRVPDALRTKVRYALHGTPNASAGPRTGARGNLRDSDPTTGRDGARLYNWAVHFEVAVQPFVTAP